MSQIAVLIDADGISHKYMGNIMKEVNSLGKVIFSLVCGTEKHLRGWRKINKEYQFIEIEAPVGKNSTDRVLVREAIDITIHSPEIDVFFLVTNDSDFVLPSQILHEWKKQVIFIGSKHAAKLIKNSNEFIEIDLPNKLFLKSKKTSQTSKSSKSKTINEFLQLLKKAFITLNQEWVSLPELGKILKGINPTYKKKYSIGGLSKQLKKLSQFVELNENMVRLKG